MALQRYGRLPALGLTSLNQDAIGNYVQVNACGDPEWGAIGFNIAWDAIPAATVAGNVAVDGTPYVAGDKVIPFGTVLVKVDTGTYAGSYVPFPSAPPVAAPTVAPSGTDSGAGALAAGNYTVAYAYRNANGSTQISPTTTVAVGASRKVTVSAITLPAGVTSVDWYFSKAAGNSDVAFLVNKTTGAAFDINSLPAGGAAEEPTDNTTYFPGTTTLERSACGITNVTVKETDKFSDNMGLLVGGTSWKERIKAGGAGQPSFSALEAALPRLSYVKP